MNTKYFVIVAAMTAVLIGATALATDSAFATKYNKNQATSQTNACGNGFLSTNVGCQNTNSQIQGDENVVTQAAQQTFPDSEFDHGHDKPMPKPMPMQ